MGVKFEILDLGGLRSLFPSEGFNSGGTCQ